MKVYVLIQTQVGRTGEVTTEIRKHAGVRHADAVTGSWDVVVEVDSDEIKDLNDLGRYVINDLQQIDGITRTVTCAVVRSH
jgi:DNA-binding Lrp family transcriptional regulator